MVSDIQKFPTQEEAFMPDDEEQFFEREDEQTALRDFEEFLDPNVLEDEDFKMNEKIIKQL